MSLLFWNFFQSGEVAPMWCSINAYHTNMCCVGIYLDTTVPRTTVLYSVSSRVLGRCVLMNALRYVLVVCETAMDGVAGIKMTVKCHSCLSQHTWPRWCVDSDRLTFIRLLLNNHANLHVPKNHQGNQKKKKKVTVMRFLVALQIRNKFHWALCGHHNLHNANGNCTGL